MPAEAWITLATNDTYALGAAVLAHSLRRVETTRAIVVMIAPPVTQSMRELLGHVFDEVRLVDVMDSQDPAHLSLIGRPDLGVTFTKLHCWTFTQFEKCVFLDADTLVLQNCDELFSRQELTAAPDPGWPSCFNSGVFVFLPSHETFNRLLRHATSHGTFDGGDQGLLNSFFNDWYSKPHAFRLPFTYNTAASAVYTYLAAHQHFAKDVKIVHFIGAAKPWHVDSGANEYWALWWQIFREHVQPKVTEHHVPSLNEHMQKTIRESLQTRHFDYGPPDSLGGGALLSGSSIPPRAEFSECYGDHLPLDPAAAPFTYSTDLGNFYQVTEDRFDPAAQKPDPNPYGPPPPHEYGGNERSESLPPDEVAGNFPGQTPFFDRDKTEALDQNNNFNFGQVIWDNPSQTEGQPMENETYSDASESPLGSCHSFEEPRPTPAQFDEFFDASDQFSSDDLNACSDGSGVSPVAELRGPVDLHIETRLFSNGFSDETRSTRGRRPSESEYFVTQVATNVSPTSGVLTDVVSMDADVLAAKRKASLGFDQRNTRESFGISDQIRPEPPVVGTAGRRSILKKAQKSVGEIRKSARQQQTAAADQSRQLTHAALEITPPQPTPSPDVYKRAHLVRRRRPEYPHPATPLHAHVFVVLILPLGLPESQLDRMEDAYARRLMQNKRAVRSRPTRTHGKWTPETSRSSATRPVTGRNGPKTRRDPKTNDYEIGIKANLEFEDGGSSVGVKKPGPLEFILSEKSAPDPILGHREHMENKRPSLTGKLSTALEQLVFRPNVLGGTKHVEEIISGKEQNRPQPDHSVFPKRSLPALLPPERIRNPRIVPHSAENRPGSRKEEVGSVLGRVVTLDPEQQRRNWEEGRADFMGADSWDNIQKQLDQGLNGKK